MSYVLSRPFPRARQRKARKLILLSRAVLRTNFVLTASVDGILKFWKKRPVGVEFVKLYRTHLSPILAVPVSDDGKSCASLGADSGGRTAEGLEVKGSAKVFDVENFGESPPPRFAFNNG